MLRVIRVDGAAGHHRESAKNLSKKRLKRSAVPPRGLFTVQRHRRGPDANEGHGRTRHQPSRLRHETAKQHDRARASDRPRITRANSSQARATDSISTTSATTTTATATATATALHLTASRSSLGRSVVSDAPLGRSHSPRLVLPSRSSIQPPGTCQRLAKVEKLLLSAHPGATELKQSTTYHPTPGPNGPAERMYRYRRDPVNWTLGPT